MFQIGSAAVSSQQQVPNKEVSVKDKERKLCYIVAYRSSIALPHLYYACLDYPGSSHSLTHLSLFDPCGMFGFVFGFLS